MEWKTGRNPKMGKKWRRTIENGPRPEMGKKWPKNGVKIENFKMTPNPIFSPFLEHFFPISGRGPFSIVRRNVFPFLDFGPFSILYQAA